MKALTAEGGRIRMSLHSLCSCHLYSYFIILLFLFCLVSIDIPAQAQSTTPDKLFSRVGFDQRLNGQVPLNLGFRDETGQPVRLGDYFGKKPVILSLTYYKCPMLCTEVLNGLVRGLEDLSFNIGNQFNVVTVSFNPMETPELAAAKKKTYIQRYGRPGVADGWHFLTGNQDSIQRLTQAVGFRYAYDPRLDQYAHATGVMVLTPQGKISRYLYGIEYSPRDLRLGLVEASTNKIGSPVDQVLLRCYHYDPATGRYSLVVMNVIQIAGMATALVLGTFIFVLLKRDRHKKPGVENQDSNVED